MTAYRRSGGGIGFYEQAGDVETLRLPCGRCVGCRLDRASSWSVRCQHEAALFDRNCFVTLTYDDDSIPVDGSLFYRHVQLFLKRLRKEFRGDAAGPNGRFPIRFFCGGEYGEVTSRPHYHLLLFNFDFPQKSKIGKRIFDSPALSRLWPHGHSNVGSLTPASAAYVSKYAVKKVYGRDSDLAYVDAATGAVRRSEFCTMSRRPGIGAWWFERFGSEVLPADYVIVEGKKKRVPRFYSNRFEMSDPEGFGAVKEARELAVLARPVEDRAFERLAVEEEVAAARLKTFSKRGL